MMKRSAASERSSRSFKLSHQRLVITNIDFARQYISGFTELTIYPLCKLSFINLNSRQTHIIRATVAGISVSFESNDPQVPLSRPSKKRALDAFAVGHQQALNSSHLDLGGSGELVLRLPPDVQSHIQERKPLQVTVEFSLEKPKSGLHFVIPPGDGSFTKRGAHVFSYSYGNSSRMWFPCVDMLSEICTWDIEVTVPSDMLVVSCGKLMEQILSDDERLKTYVFNLSVPTSACKIGLTAGAFQVISDPKVEEMMYFCPPELAGLVHHCTSFMHEVFGFYQDFLSTNYPYTCFKVVFVDEGYTDLASYASMSIISVYALHSPRYIEQTVASRQLLSLALAQQYFGCFLCPKSWNEVWLSTGAAAYIQLMFQRRMFGNSHYRCLLKQAVDRVCQLENQTGGIPALHPRKLSELPSTESGGTAPAEQEQQHRHNEDSRSSSLHPHALHGGASAWSSDTFGRDRIALQQGQDQKSLLVMHMLAAHTGQDCVMQAFNKLLALGVAASEQSIICGAWNNVLLSTDTFVRAVTSVSGKTLDTFLRYWVYQSGCANFVAKFSYNRKRNGLEVHVHQDAPSNRRYAGPLTINVQELDGSFQHVIQVEAVDRSYEIPCHSKARRTKKKRIALVTGEEVDMDLSLVESDSPVLWLRLDPDMGWLRSVKLEQPDYMWQLQVLHERDVVGQIEACKALREFATQNTRKVLADAISHQRFFYRVRCCAAQSLASVITSSQDVATPHSALTAVYRKMFGCNSQRDMVRLNDFRSLADYYVQKEIPLALATIRNGRSQCPREIVTFLSNLMKYNDNRSNQYSDVLMIVALLESLAQTVTQSEPAPVVHQSASGSSVSSTVSVIAPEAAIVVNEITQRLNMEKLIPSFGLKVSCTCLTGLGVLQQHGHIAGCLETFKKHAAYGLITDMRLAALQCIVNYVRAENSQSELLWLLDLVEKDPNPSVRVRIIRMLILNPPFSRKSSSALNNETVVDRLWHLLTVTSAHDMQLRCCLGELYGLLFGWLTPSCVPASGLGLYIDLKKKKSRTHLAEQSPSSKSNGMFERRESLTADVVKPADESDSGIRLKIKMGGAPVVEASTAPTKSDNRMDTSSASSTTFAPRQAQPQAVAAAAAAASPILFAPQSTEATSAQPIPPLIVKSHKRSHAEMSKKDGEKPLSSSHKKAKKEKHKHKHKHKHHHKDGEHKESKKSSSSHTAQFLPPRVGS
ncbi:transcription initiation factor TFIID subunit 2-like isoform X2 [Sycon ciliatum]|uniref:transcription initiation factor TFIID subunit 2-like isoform X1 n=1 Tax=Sycon ciliatum TaxID=27933 RepID=UPI0031F60B33